MVIKQLSIFLENKTGRLNDVAKLLGDSGINMTAYSLADNSDFGILRVIVSDPAKAEKILKENKLPYKANHNSFDYIAYNEFINNKKED